GKLKTFCGNKARPEGSIAEGWRAEEIFNFTSQFFDDHVETRWNRDNRVSNAPDAPVRDTEVTFSVGKPVGARQMFKLTETEMLQAHRHVLVNCPIVEPYMDYNYGGCDGIIP
ncbi:hypothetical protein LINGRAHAP2_LOCUS20122, partial [Linum grandiflorum]